MNEFFIGPGDSASRRSLVSAVAYVPAISTAQIKLMQNNQQDMGSSVHESGPVFAVGKMRSRHEWTYVINSLQNNCLNLFAQKEDAACLPLCIHESRLAFLAAHTFLKNQGLADSHFEPDFLVAIPDIAPHDSF
jgi:hypothetical protein